MSQAVDARAPVDVLIVGAGPTGLACAIEARRLGLTARVLEQGSVVDAIRRFPTDMGFFTTRERIEIGGLPLTIAASKPSRAEALAYYRAVVAHFQLDVRTHARVLSVSGADGAFCARTRDRFGVEREHHGRKVVVATGYFDHPNLLGVAGEDLPHVSHYFHEAHAAAGLRAVVVGGGNSAAEAALELFRAGAQVTVVVRRADFDAGLKYWVRPDIENRIAAGEIAASFGARVSRIDARGVRVEGPGGTSEVAADFVYLLTGYHPDLDFLRHLGIAIDADTWRPAVDAASLESNVPGIYLAGSVSCGRSTNQIFIENGRFDATRILPHLERALRGAAQP